MTRRTNSMILAGGALALAAVTALTSASTLWISLFR
jgi:hypothetical protein